ncbi:MAG TPA: hypothetical protein VLM89_09035 [Phycisphaerae bacterium]|nr:hypothetical protein [Phycisphaerae bacterium]
MSKKRDHNETSELKTHDLLTTDEVIQRLRLREMKVKIPLRTLLRLRQQGLLQGLRCSKSWLWPRAAVEKYIETGLHQGAYSGD